jgi:nicotinate-nucleotide pyrophosphorylase (carboxylating)
MSDTDDRRLIDELLKQALAEDLGAEGDITSQAICAPDRTAAASIIAKAPGVLSGGILLAPLFARVDPSVAVSVAAPDGSRLAEGTVVARLEGPIRAILAGERTALNLLQHLSGIATLSSRMVAAIGPAKTRLLDTRKTTPLLRALEKKAVRDGGGHNHRFGLFDMVLIKHTHVTAAGGVAAAIRAVRAARSGHPCLAIEAEVGSVAEFREALTERPDRIMLDNMNLADMRECVALARRSGASVELEASGNVTMDTVRAVAETGVDFISCGSITHSAPALDMHLVIA